MVERLIAGDSREWVVNVKEHFQCIRMPNQRLSSGRLPVAW